MLTKFVSFATKNYLYLVQIHLYLSIKYHLLVFLSSDSPLSFQSLPKIIVQAMKKTDNLFQLIRSMRKAEKRYFKLYASRQGSTKQNYLLLFDAIDAQDNYDEAALRERFRDESFSNHFSVAKRYLYNSILKSLKLFFADYCISVKIPDAIKEMRVLLNKGMFAQALKQYQKTEQIFRANEQYGGLLDLLTFGEQLWRASLNNSEAAIKIREVHREKQACIKYLANLNEYLFIRSEIEYVFWENAPARTVEAERKLDALLTDPLLQNEHQALSISAKMAYYDCLMMIYQGKMDFVNLYKICNRALELLDVDNQGINHYFTFNWHTTVYHHLTLACGQLSLPQECDCAFEQFKNYTQKYKEQVNILDSINGQVKLLDSIIYRYFVHSNYIAVIQSVEERTAFLNENWDYLPPDYRGNIALLVAQSYLITGNPPVALVWVERITEYEKSYSLAGQVCTARLLQIMIHTQSKHYFLLKSLLRSAYRQVVKRDRLFEPERLFFKYFNKIAKHHSLNFNEHLLALQQELSTIKDIFDLRFLLELDVESWIETHEIGKNSTPTDSWKRREIIRKSD